MDVEIGQLLDKKYKIVRLLGEGGMGAVYEGENVRIHHRVAIKVLHPNVATDTGAQERFEREAQAAGRIGSEHICEVFDLGELPSGARYMVMEFLAGESLSARVTKLGRIPAAQMGPLMLQLLDGLGAAHAAGIIHRDLKPDNVFLQRAKNGSDFVKIVDFGVSKFNHLSGGSGMSMTRTGAVVGTPYYMSPEQVRGAKLVDHRSDLYSVGVVVFECITGVLPFEAETFNELMFKIALEPPRDPEQLVPGLDPRFAAIVRKSMAREPDGRYASAQEFAQATMDWMQAANIPMLGMGSGAGNTTPFATSQAGPPPAEPTAPAAPMATTGANNLGLDKTTASGSLSRTPPPPQKRSGPPVVAIAVGAAVLVAAAGIGVMQMSKGKAPVAQPAAAAAAPLSAPSELPAAATAPPPVMTAAPATIAPPQAATLAAPPAATVPAATSETAAPAAAPMHAAGHAVATAAPVHAAAPAPGPAPASSAANSMTLKGRTIRTEL